MRSASRVRRVGAAASILTVGLLGWAGVASAHVEASPASVPIGDPSSVAFMVPNECAGSTTGVSVQLPDGAADVSPDEVPGWTSSVGAASPAVIEWSGGTISGTAKQQFSISLALTGEVDDIVYFPTVQNCDDGTVISWIEIPATPDASEPVHPAPSVRLAKGSGVLPSVTVPVTGPTVPPVPETSTTTVLATTTTTTLPASSGDLSQVDSGLSNGALLVIATVLAVLVAAGLVVMAKRRQADAAAEAEADADADAEGTPPSPGSDPQPFDS